MELQNALINTGIQLEEYHQRSIFDSNCIEFWAPVTDFVIPNIVPNRYWVSTFGNTYDMKSGKPFGLSTHGKGYFQMPFKTLDGKRITRKLHRVIMLTFCYVPGCENLEVNHKDSNRKNNNITNLEWATSSENTIHGILYGNKTVFGNKDAIVLLTDEDVGQIIKYYNSGHSTSDIYSVYKQKYPDLNFLLIKNICSGSCRLAYRHAHNI